LVSLEAAFHLRKRFSSLFILKIFKIIEIKLLYRSLKLYWKI